MEGKKRLKQSQSRDHKSWDQESLSDKLEPEILRLSTKNYADDNWN